MIYYQSQKSVLIILLGRGLWTPLRHRVPGIFDRKIPIEVSMHSVQISISVKKADEIEKIYVSQVKRFVMILRAVNFIVLRRKPVKVQ